MANLTMEAWEDQGGDMLAFVDPKTKHVIECNEMLADSIGYNKSNLIGRSVFDLHLTSCRHTAKKVFSTFLKAKSVPDAELYLKKKGGGKIPVSLRLSGSEDEQGQIRCTRFSWHNMSRRKKTQETLQNEKRQLKNRLLSRLTDLRKTKIIARNERQKRRSAETKVYQALRVLRQQRKYLRILAGKLISIQEDERRRLARDLHDDTCQKLGMLAFETEALGQTLPESPEMIQKELQSLHNKITALATTVRSLAHQLHPAVLDYLGPVKAIESYIEDFAQREDLRVSFTHKNIPKTLPQNIGNCLYRITQECLGNSAKHGHASKVHVSLLGFSKSLRLTIRDNGIGFSPKQLETFKQGLGFISMQERLRLVKGSLGVGSKKGHGAEIVARIPFFKSHP